MKNNRRSIARPQSASLAAIASATVALLAPCLATAQSAPATTSPQALDTVTVTGNWLGSGLQNSVKSFPGARTVLDRDAIQETGAATIGDVVRRIPGVQASENSSSAGSAISLNIGVRGLTGRFSPRSTVLLDGIPLAVAPYGQPQLSFSAVSLANIDSIDVVRGAGAVRYGPQNVGGIINFTTRAIPTAPGVHGEASVRYNSFGQGGSNTQTSAFVGSTSDSGLGVALLYSGQRGAEWRDASGDRVDDVAVKARYALSATSEVYGKVSYYDADSRTPGGLTVAQYNADPFQNTRPTDSWNGNRKGVDVGYVNTLSSTQEFEVRAYYNDSFRQSALINAARTQLAIQPRNYTVQGLEPRYTQRVALAGATHDFTLGYRYLRETGDDNSFSQSIATGARGTTTRFDNATTAHAVYLDDRIAHGAWRITPGVRYERISSDRDDLATRQAFSTRNNKALPSLSIAYLLNGAATVFANYGTSFGPVQNIQLNSQTSANPLKPELAETVEVGGRWKDAGLSAELTLFQIRFDNQIQQVPLIAPPTFQNIGATKHDGVEAAVDYAFARGSALAGLNLYATLTHMRAIQKSGPSAGLDVPFYSRDTDTLGARYKVRAFTINVNSTHQSSQFADNANTVAEPANASNGPIPGFRLWNALVSWDVSAVKALQLQLGVNNIGDKRYYTRNVDSNAGRMVGAPRTAFVQARLGF